MKVSSVSPERCETMTPQPLDWASLHLDVRKQPRCLGLRSWAQQPHQALLMPGFTTPGRPEEQPEPEATAKLSTPGDNNPHIPLHSQSPEDLLTSHLKIGVQPP